MCPSLWCIGAQYEYSNQTDENVSGSECSQVLSKTFVAKYIAYSFLCRFYQIFLAVEWQEHSSEAPTIS